MYQYKCKVATNIPESIGFASSGMTVRVTDDGTVYGNAYQQEDMYEHGKLIISGANFYSFILSNDNYNATLTFTSTQGLHVYQIKLMNGKSDLEQEIVALMGIPAHSPLLEAYALEDQYVDGHDDVEEFIHNFRKTYKEIRGTSVKYDTWEEFNRKEVYEKERDGE